MIYNVQLFIIIFISENSVLHCDVDDIFAYNINSE